MGGSARVYRVDPECPSTEVLREAAAIINGGGLVVYPTDTLYGLAASPWSREAVERAFEAKERSRDKPLPIIVAESHHAILFIEPPEAFWSLALKYWPGPLTIVAPAADGAPSYLAWKGYVGVRLPDSVIARRLARLAGGAITGTSANISGMPAPRTAQEAMSMLGDRVDAYIDAGPTPLGKPSTVVLVEGDNVEVLRVGAIPESDILETVRGARR